MNSAFFQKRRKKSGGELYTVKLFELGIFQERKKACSYARKISDMIQYCPVTFKTLLSPAFLYNLLNANGLCEVMQNLH